MTKPLPFRVFDCTTTGTLDREWLITNGLGGYAAGTVGGKTTRRYHALLVSAQPTPLGRVLMLRHMEERVLLPDGESFVLGEQPSTALDSAPSPHLQELGFDAGLPVWTYAAHGLTIERRIVMPHGQNTTCVRYRLLGADPTGGARLQLRPGIRFRPHDESYEERRPLPAYAITLLGGGRYEIAGEQDFPVLRLSLQASDVQLVTDGGARRELFLRTEAERGYPSRDSSWDAGSFVFPLLAGCDHALVASTEAWSVIDALSPQQAIDAERERARALLERSTPTVRDEIGADLVLAADRFVIEPVGRAGERARARATGDAVRAVVAGYHWFTDWGRDTMISLEGLTLVTGRLEEAGSIVRSFGRYVRDGLVPNLFPEGADSGLYHTADATLWFFHALDRYLAYSGDRRTLHLLLPQLVAIADHHLRGTRFGIGVDPADGLLVQGAAGYQLTWMDAKVGDWVVTPRRGKAVEINALFYNALQLLATWLDENDGFGEASQYRAAAERVRTSFAARFWFEPGAHCYDVVDGEHGDDPALRPNQLLQFTLRHRVLAPEHWPDVLAAARAKLLTPVGLRTLSPDHPAYAKQYFGDLRARDAAYHQGTVWPWLVGCYIDTWLACAPRERAEARGFLAELVRRVDVDCLGSISEICDAEAPYAPRGCVAQAWSVAEVLRAWHRTAPGEGE